MYREFSNSAVKANEEVRRFKQLMDDEDTKKIFKYAKESRAANPKGITPWRITDHPDWLEKSPR
jgi:hypothetical protein